jgi:hypothetical protein
MHQDIEAKQRIDSEIIKFLTTIKNLIDVSQWKKFRFLAGNHPDYQYIDFDLANLKRHYGYEFLDRIVLFEGENEAYGTVIGAYQGALYINLDSQHHAIPITPACQHLKLEYRLITGFESVEHFQHLYLGFYLIARGKAENAKVEELDKKLPVIKHFFTTKMANNENYLNNTKLILATSKRVKTLPKP